MLGESVAVVLDGGPSPKGEASTILDVRGARPRVLRRGALSVEALDEVLEPLGSTVIDDDDGLRRPATSVREYLLVFLVAAAATYLLTVIAREIALRTGAVAQVRDRDVHAEPIPYLGGLAMLGGLVAAYLVAQQLPFLSRSQPFVFHDARIVLIAGAMICAVGTLDDLFELDALTKLGGQVLAAGFLILNGIQYILFPQPGGGQFALDPAQGALLTAFVVVATVNAVNFVDGLDGLAAGVVGIGALAFFVVLLPADQPQQRLARLHRRAAERDARRASASASCPTTSTRPGSSWATAARC